MPSGGSESRMKSELTTMMASVQTSETLYETNCESDEARAVSTFCTSPEKRLMMRPSGVTSKKDAGDAKTARTASSWIRRPALTEAYARSTDRSRMQSAETSAAAT